MDIRDVAPKSKNLEQPDNNGNDNNAAFKIDFMEAAIGKT